MIGGYIGKPIGGVMRPRYVALAAVGAYVLTGIAALKKITRSSAVGTYVLAGISATLRKGYTIVSVVGSYTLTGQAAYQAITFVTAAGAYVLTGIAATLTTSARQTLILAAAIGTYTLTGIASGAAQARRTAVGTYLYTGQIVVVTKGVLMTAAGTAFGLVGKNANLTSLRRMTAAAGSYVLTGIAAVLVKLTPGATVLVAAVGSYTLYGRNVAFDFIQRLRQRGRVRHSAPHLYKTRDTAVTLAQVRDTAARLFKRRST